MNAEFSKVSAKVCWVIFLVLHLLIMSLMIVSLTVPTWVYQDSDETTYDWKGGLLEVTEGNDGWEDLSYRELAENFCDKENIADFNLDENTIKDLCDMYTDLYIASTIFLILETLAIVLLGITAATNAIVFRTLSFISCSYCSASCSLIMHIAGLFCFILFPNITLNRECDTLGKEMCADDGVI